MIKDVESPYRVDEEYSDEYLEVYGKHPAWIVRSGITLILLAFLGVVLFSWFIRYPDQLVTSIIVTSKNPIEKIESKINGKMSAVFVKNEDQVQEGQVLAILENSASFGDVEFLRSLLEEKTADDGQLHVLLEKGKNLKLGSIAPYYTAFEKIYTDWTLNQRFNPFDHQARSLQTLIQEYEHRLSLLEEQQKLAGSELSLKKSGYDRQSKLFTDKVISSLDFERDQLSYLESQRLYTNNSITISTTRENLITARRSLAEVQMEKERTGITLSKGASLAFQELQSAIANWQQQFLLRSSTNGKVSLHKYWASNQFIKEGEVIMTVLPDLATTSVGKITLPARNTGKIRKGQKVIVRLDNYPFQEYGVLYGTVSNLSITADKDGKYYADVAFPNGLVTSYGEQLVLDHELTGRADIVTANLRLIERVLFSLRKLTSRN